MQPLLRAQSVTYTTLDYPGAVDTYLAAIDGSNVVGRYDSGNDSNGNGFFYNGSTFTSLAVNGSSTFYLPVAVSGNNVVGNYMDANENSHGFLYNNGTHTTLDFPGANVGSTYPTTVMGVSGNNVVGSYYDGLTSHGFLYNNGSYITLDPPSSIYTVVSSISGNNVVGTYEDGSTLHLSHGFLYNNGIYTTLDAPGAETGTTTALCVSGDNVAGLYRVDYETLVGFIYNGTTYTTIYPNDTGMSVRSILGISGNTALGSSVNSLCFIFNTGSLTDVSPSAPELSPGPVYSDQYFPVPTGISGNRIVGNYETTTAQGFLATYTPPNATVTLGNIAAVYDGTPKMVTATTNPVGLAVTISPKSETGAGRYYVTATVNEGAYHCNAATFQVISPATATVTLGNLTATYSGMPHAVTATTNPAGLTVDLTYNGAGFAPTAVGSYTVVGTIDTGRDPNYQGTATGTLNILLTQSINFPAIANQKYPSPTVALNATASSGLPVSYSVIAGPASVSGSGLTINGTGMVTVQAIQTGNSSYAAATSVKQSFLVSMPVNFTSWEGQQGFFTAQQQGDPATSGSTATPKNDGVPNGLKYLYNINPSTPMSAADRAALPMIGEAKIGGKQYLTLTYREYALQTGVTVNLQTSSDLMNWTTVTNPTLIQTGTDSITGDPLMQFQLPTSGEAQFVRLNVTEP